MDKVKCSLCEGNCKEIPESILREEWDRLGYRQLSDKEAGERYRTLQVQACVESTHYKVFINDMEIRINAYKKGRNGSYSLITKKEAIRLAKQKIKLVESISKAK